MAKFFNSKSLKSIDGLVITPFTQRSYIDPDILRKHKVSESIIKKATINKTPEPPNLAQWMLIMLDNIPVGKLMGEDMKHFIPLQRYLMEHKDDDGLLHIDDEDLNWFKRAFWNDEYAARLTNGQFGPLAYNMFGPKLGIALDEIFDKPSKNKKK